MNIQILYLSPERIHHLKTISKVYLRHYFTFIFSYN